MLYKPNYTIHQQPTPEQKKEMTKNLVDEIYDMPRHPVSDMTQFVVASTTIDTQKMADPRFRDRHENEILSIDKFAPLSNIDLTDQLLTRLIWMDMVFAQRMGMTQRAERKALEIVRIYNESRGREGQFTKALITTRQELVSRHRQEESEKKKGRFGFMRKKEPIMQDYSQQPGGFPQ